MFDYYCRKFGFDSVEINSSFYRLPAAKSMASLARRSPDGFHFMVKLFHGFTHNRILATGETFANFRRGIAPLAEAGKLRGLLAQFSSNFLPSKQAVCWLKRLQEELQPQPLFVEFRHCLWSRPEAFAFLRRQEIGYCIPDLPRLAPLPRFTPAVTNGIGYVRLHGRNREWYRPTTSRYDYQYSDAELQDIYARTADLVPTPLEVFFFFNNCHGAAAVRSAKRLLALSLQAELV